MTNILVKRPDHIKGILSETIEEFARRGYEVTIDQAHSLHDLVYWEGLSSTKNLVGRMIRDHMEVV